MSRALYDEEKDAQDILFSCRNMQICLILIILFAKCPFPHSIDTEKVQQESRAFISILLD